VEIGEAIIDDDVESVAAYYSSWSRAITVLAAEDDEDRVDRMATLSHEFTHYLQDLTEPDGLAGLREDIGATLDADVAATSLTEGDAVVTSARVYAWLNGWHADELVVDRYYEAVFESTYEDVASSDVPLYVAAETYLYSVGGRHVHRTWDVFGRAAVDDLFAHPHGAFVDWLGAFTESGLAALTDSSEPLDCAPPLAPGELERYGWDSFGAAAVLALLGQDPELTSETVAYTAAALRGDMFVVYASTQGDDAPEAPMAVAWRLRFDSEQSATFFATRAAPLLSERARIDAFGVEVLLTATNAEVEPFDDAARASCPSVDDVLRSDDAEPAMALRRGLVRAGGFEPP
jgi:hypothetical protein